MTSKSRAQVAGALAVAVPRVGVPVDCHQILLVEVVLDVLCEALPPARLGAVGLPELGVERRLAGAAIREGGAAPSRDLGVDPASERDDVGGVVDVRRPATDEADLLVLILGVRDEERTAAVP